MTSYNIVHFQNAADGRENELAHWHRHTLAPAVLDIAGIRAVQFMQLQAVQMQPKNVQPWRLATLVEFDSEESPTLLRRYASLARDPPRHDGLLQDDAAHVFELTRAHLPTSLPVDASAPLHCAFVMGNCIEGCEPEYDAWYDTVHSLEVLGTPGFVSMRRGVVSTDQAAPLNAQPANRLVLLHIRSHDLQACIDEFISRAHGTSSSGVKWAPREAAAGFASLQRTTHVFTPYTPRLERHALRGRE